MSLFMCFNFSINLLTVDLLTVKSCKIINPFCPLISFAIAYRHAREILHLIASRGSHRTLKRIFVEIYAKPKDVRKCSFATKLALEVKRCFGFFIFNKVKPHINHSSRFLYHFGHNLHRLFKTFTHDLHN